MKVTGPKTDTRLVKTVAVVLLSITLSLFTGYYEASSLFPALVPAFASAPGLAAIDFWYGLRGVISRVYIFDGVLQLFFSVAWIVVPERS